MAVSKDTKNIFNFNSLKKINTLHSIKYFDINKYFENISTNKLFIGLMMIFMNIGSRYIEIKLTKGQEMIVKNIAREVLIFTIAFMGSRDIFISLIITAVFIILSNFVFNENSKYCILPSKYKQLSSVMDLDGDGKVSEEELNKAYEILKKAKQQEQTNNKINMLNNIS
tara:strand:+ start:2948 stop:3454 length:507 start_codon:yes stop_codon:yes gene_type:complete